MTPKKVLASVETTADESLGSCVAAMSPGSKVLTVGAWGVRAISSAEAKDEVCGVERLG
jgi:hypothetical protein